MRLFSVLPALSLLLAARTLAAPSPRGFRGRGNPFDRMPLRRQAEDVPIGDEPVEDVPADDTPTGDDDTAPTADPGPGVIELTAPKASVFRPLSQAEAVSPPSLVERTESA